MRTSPAALLLLVGPFVSACATPSDVTGAPTAASYDAGLSSDASAAEDAGSALDAAAMADADATSNAQCRWPADLNPPSDGGRSLATVGRYLLSCKVAPARDGGPMELCTSNDPNACPGPPPGAAVSVLVDCADQCSADEYALSLGGRAGAPNGPTAPAGCRSMDSTEGSTSIFSGYWDGSTFFCCPCEAADAATDADAMADGSTQSGLPSCSSDQTCASTPSGPQCLPRCDPRGCPAGDECTTMGGCCAGTYCTATLVRVCCPPTGC